MQLYNVLLNNKIPFVLLENNESENVIYCKSFTDYLFNVGIFQTKTKEIILEYVIEDGEKFVTVDITLEDGTCYRQVPFHIIVNENIDTPYSTINLNLLQGGEAVELPTQPVQIIQEVIEEKPLPGAVPCIPTPDYTETVQEALQLEKQLQHEKQALEKQKIILEKQNIINKKLAEYKQELLEEYFNATRKQSEVLDLKINDNLKNLEEDLKERIYNTFQDYSVQFETQDKITQQDHLNKLLQKIDETIKANRKEIDEIVNDKILLENDENRKKLEKQSKLLEKNYNDRLIVELEKYKESLFTDFTDLSKIRVEEVLSEKSSELFEKIQSIEDKVKKLLEEKTKFAEKGKFTEDQQKYIADTAQYWARRILDLGGGGGSVAVQYAKGGTMDGTLNVNGHILSGGKNLSDYFGSGGGGSQSLSFNQINYDLSITGGNTVNLGGLKDNLSEITSISANWTLAYTNLITNSAAYLLSGTNTDLGNIPTLSSNWNSTYSTVNTFSASWEESPDITNLQNQVTALQNAIILTNNQYELSASIYSIFLKSVTEENVFTYNNFTSGKTITVYLSASHTGVIGHYFPINTYFNANGSSNIVYTFANYTTKITLQNAGNYFLASTVLIPTQVIQYDKSLGDALLDELFGFIIQENSDRILLE